MGLGEEKYSTGIRSFYFFKKNTKKLKWSKDTKNTMNSYISEETQKVWSVTLKNTIERETRSNSDNLKPYER